MKHITSAVFRICTLLVLCRITHWLKIFQFRLLVIEKGYTAYITVLYIIGGLVAANLSYAVAVALMLQHNKRDSFFTR